MTNPSAPGGWQDPGQPPSGDQPSGYPPPQWQPPPPPPPPPYGANPGGGGGAPGGFGPPAAPPPPNNTMAIVSMIVSIVGAVTLLCGCCVTFLGALAIPIGGVGAVLGHLSVKQIKERNERGHGMAMSGIIVGWISAGLGLLWLIFAILVLVGAFGGYTFLDDPAFS